MSESDRVERNAVETSLKEILAAEVGLDGGDGIDTSKCLRSDFDVSSLSLLTIRETVERVFNVFISDNEWFDYRSIDDLIDSIIRKRSLGKNTAGSGIELEAKTFQTTSRIHDSGGKVLTSSGLLCEDLEIGMSLTGRNNLSEGPLLQRIGDLRWHHISALTGIPSSRIVDDAGQRLYATFFYVEMAFPERKPLASYGENDHIKLVCNARRYGQSMIDGVTYFLPGDVPPPDQLPFEEIEQALQAGVPTVRLSNIFVSQFAGSEWLKKSRPVNPGFERIPGDSLAPDSYAIVKQAQKEGHFSLPERTHIPMTKGPVEIEYHLVPDRDLNGAGLVYFANYPVFLDICERRVLESAPLLLSDAQIDKRTIVRRKSAYLNNASARDTLIIQVQPWIENPFLMHHQTPEMAPIRLTINFQMRRKSDNRVMMVSTAEKIVFGIPLEEVPFFSKLPELLPE